MQAQQFRLNVQRAEAPSAVGIRLRELIDPDSCLLPLLKKTPREYNLRLDLFLSPAGLLYSTQPFIFRQGSVRRSPPAPPFVYGSG